MRIATKRARKTEPQSEAQPEGLWINSSRLPTRLAQKGRENKNLEIARLTQPPDRQDPHARYLELANKALKG